MQIKRFIKSYLTDQTGVAATEFALIAPVLIVILIGTIDAGSYINARMKIETAARTVTEYMLSGGNEDNVMDNVLAYFYEEPQEEGVQSVGWQDALTVDVGMVCECADGAVIDCQSGSCDSDDYKRRYYETTLTSQYETMFPYPYIDAHQEVRGHARLQLD